MRVESDCQWSRPARDWVGVWERCVRQSACVRASHPSPSSLLPSAPRQLPAGCLARLWRRQTSKPRAHHRPTDRPRRAQPAHSQRQHHEPTRERKQLERRGQLDMHEATRGGEFETNLSLSGFESANIIGASTRRARGWNNNLTTMRSNPAVDASRTSTAGRPGPACCRAAARRRPRGTPTARARAGRASWFDCWARTGG